MALNAQENSILESSLFEYLQQLDEASYEETISVIRKVFDYESIEVTDDQVSELLDQLSQILAAIKSSNLDGKRVRLEGGAAVYQQISQNIKTFFETLGCTYSTSIKPGTQDTVLESIQYQGTIIAETKNYMLFLPNVSNVMGLCYGELLIEETNLKNNLLQQKTANSNGTIEPDSEYLGLSQVDVNVQPKLQEKIAIQNGEVLPDSDYDGLSKVIVDVPTSGSGSSSSGKTYYHFARQDILEVYDYDWSDFSSFAISDPDGQSMLYRILKPAYGGTQGAYVDTIKVTGPGFFSQNGKFNNETIDDFNQTLASATESNETYKFDEYITNNFTEADWISNTFGIEYDEIVSGTTTTVTKEPVLEEKTFTQNGTYTPDEGVDGFNKVTVQVETSVPIEISTEEEMDEFITEANKDKVAKYVGTAGKYQTDSLYLIKEV